MHAAALSRGKAMGYDKAHYIDVYTGRELIGGDSYDYEHIRSSEEIHTKYKSCLTDEQIALVVNCPENIGVTLSSINKSKGKRRMEEWLNKPTNIVANRINLKWTLSNVKKADEGITRMVTKLSNSKV